MKTPSHEKPSLAPLDPAELLTQVRGPGERRNLSKSATRALDVLEYFAMAGRPLRAVDIAHAFGFHPSSTDQLLKTMVDSAYLVVEPQGKLYYPSPRLVRFATWLTSNYFGSDRINRLLQTVYAESEEIVTLSLRHETSMQIVDVLEPPHRVGTVAKGARVPIVGSAIGGAFLAAHSDGDVRRIVHQISKHTRRTSERIEPTVEDVRKIRRRGYAFGGITQAVDVWSLALALPKPQAGVVMVMGLAGARERIQPREAHFVALMRKNIEKWLR